MKLAARRSGADGACAKVEARRRGVVEELHGARQQRVTVLVEDETAADAVEQLHAEGALELGERAARRRLRARHPRRRGAGRAGARGRDEDLEPAQREAQTLIGYLRSW